MEQLFPSDPKGLGTVRVNDTSKIRKLNARKTKKESMGPASSSSCLFQECTEPLQNLRWCYYYCYYYIIYKCECMGTYVQ